MKKTVAFILTAILTFISLTSCDLFARDKGVTCKEYENCAVFTFDDFPIGETVSFELERTGLGEGAIYYQVNLEEGALSIKYKESGLININNEQPLGEFTADDEMPVGGSGGYVEGKKIIIIFESFSNVSGEIIIAFTQTALNAVYNELHKETCNHQWDDGVEVEGGAGAYLMEYTCTICGEKEQQIITVIPPEENHFLRNQAGAEWLREISADDIDEIKMINVSATTVKEKNKRHSDSSEIGCFSSSVCTGQIIERFVKRKIDIVGNNISLIFCQKSDIICILYTYSSLLRKRKIIERNVYFSDAVEEIEH